MLVTAKCASVLIAAVLVAACGSRSKTLTLSPADLPRVALIRAPTPGWSWPKESTQASPGPACEGRRWEDMRKLGVDFVCLFSSEADAHMALASHRAFARYWAKRTVGYGEFTDTRLDGLGDEAWQIWESFAGGLEITDGWRRANLVLQIHIHCFFRDPCPSDIRQAGRAWADAIDAEAGKAP